MEENTVFFKTLMDGQGNYGVIDISAGDTVQIRTPEDPEAESGILRFQSDADDYRDEPLKIQALISRLSRKWSRISGMTESQMWTSS